MTRPGPNPLPIKERIERKILKTSCGCWLWLGKTNAQGYGKIKIHGKYFSVHRVLYEVYKQVIFSGMNICHVCDIPSCCNPEHLFQGTQADNMKDMDRKGRRSPYSPAGESNPKAKLTRTAVKYIKTLNKTNMFTHKEIAANFGVTRSTISRICRGDGWKNDNPEEELNFEN